MSDSGSRCAAVSTVTATVIINCCTLPCQTYHRSNSAQAWIPAWWITPTASESLSKMFTVVSCVVKPLFHSVFLRSQASRCHRWNKKRNTSPLCLRWVWRLNAMAHFKAQGNCTKPDCGKKSQMFTLSTMITIRLKSEWDFLCALEAFGRGGGQSVENWNGKRDENIWLEKIIQIWLNPAGLNTLLSANRSPTEIHRNALHGRDVLLEYWEGSRN